MEFMQGRFIKADSDQVEYNVAPRKFDGQGSILSLDSGEAVTQGHFKWNGSSGNCAEWNTNLGFRAVSGWYPQV